MSYRHQWGPPQVVRRGSGPRGIWHPIQSCARCGTTRNPLTDIILRRGDSACWRHPVAPTLEEAGNAASLERLRWNLRCLEESGERVERDYAPGRTAEARANRDLFEPAGTAGG